MPLVPKKISVDILKHGMPGITCHIGGCFAEAAAVCLEDQGHTSGVILSVIGSQSNAYVIEWMPVTPQVLRSWNDLQETTEYGACCLALLLITEMTNFTVIQRSKKGSGFDYWLGDKHRNELPFINKARLEISGIRKGNDKAIDRRLKKKLAQIAKSNSTLLPAYVVVVEFSNPISKLKTDGEN